MSELRLVAAVYEQRQNGCLEVKGLARELVPCSGTELRAERKNDEWSAAGISETNTGYRAS